MKTLKILSIVGLVWYPVWFIIGLFAPDDGQTIGLLAILVNIVFLLYFVFHTVMCFLQGIKTKNTVLKIASIISCVIICFSLLFCIMIVNRLDIGANGFEKLDLSETSIQSAFSGALLIALPFVIALSIITLVQSSKALKQK